MGSPNIKTALGDNNDAIQAVQEACKKAADALANNEQKGDDYINQNTKGIVQKFERQSTWYSKFSDDFSLDALNGIIDGVVNTATDAIKLEMTEETDPDLIEKTTKDVGALVKSALGLAASSSATVENLEVSFSYMVIGESNFAVYIGYNSASVDAQNVWGKKDIKVIAITYIVAQVNPNPAIVRAEMLQKDLSTLKKLNDAYDDLEVKVAQSGNMDQISALSGIKELMDDTESRIKAEIANEKS